ncbi:MAG: polymer-forming cytoskeletal protein [Phycisphaerae bacterium]
MPKPSTARSSRQKSVVCTHCGGAVDVARRAMSVFCPNCKKRLILENYKIKTYHASRLFATCGDIVVEKGGLVSAPIRAENLMVRGRVQGDVEARGVVQVAATGQVRGDICATRLVVNSGAQLNGFCRIQPESADPPH